MNANNAPWFCPECGTQNTNKFCKRCGKPVNLQAAGSPQPPVNQPMPPGQVPPQQPGYNPPLGYVNQQSSNKNTVLMAVIGILVVVLVGGGFYFLNSKPAVTQAPPAPPPPPPTATVTNTAPQTPQYKTGHVIGTEVRVRSGPGTQYEIIGEFAYGEAVTVLEIQSEWNKVQRNNGQVGWIKGQYCSID